MELELIYAEIQYENARYDMELHRLDFCKLKEKFQHVQKLQKLEQRKKEILKEQLSKSDKLFSYKPLEISDCKCNR